MVNFKAVKLRALPSILCIFLPLLGQVIMRVTELGGSLAMPWLLYIPIFWFFPLTLVPLLLAMTGLIPKEENGNVYDNYIIIPIIVKLILSFIPLNTLDFTGMYIILLVGSMLIANTIHILKQPRCDKYGTNFGGVLLRGLSDSFLQYSIGFIITWLLKFIIKIMPFINVIGYTIANISFLYKICIFLLWAMGFAGAYIVLHMNDNKEGNETYCKKPPSIIRIIVGFILFSFVIGFEIKKKSS